MEAFALDHAFGHGEASGLVRFSLHAPIRHGGPQNKDKNDAGHTEHTVIQGRASKMDMQVPDQARQRPSK